MGTTHSKDLQAIGGGVFELPHGHLVQMRQWYEAQLIHCGLNKVILDRNDAVFTEEENSLLLQVPVIYPEKKGRKKSSFD